MDLVDALEALLLYLVASMGSDGLNINNIS